MCYKQHSNWEHEGIHKSTYRCCKVTKDLRLLLLSKESKCIVVCTSPNNGNTRSNGSSSRRKHDFLCCLFVVEKEEMRKTRETQTREVHAALRRNNTESCWQSCTWFINRPLCHFPSDSTLQYQLDNCNG